jgi:hypothetical protein
MKRRSGLNPPEKLVRDMPKAAIIGTAKNSENPKRLGNKKTATTGQGERCKLLFMNNPS